MKSSTSKDSIGSPKQTKQIVKQHNFTMKKSLGQNFLTDQNILRNIVAAADLTKEKAVLEIGPGIGALTECLAQEAGKVVALEIDQRLLPILEQTLVSYDHCTVVHGDILKTDLPLFYKTHFSSYEKVSVVANLPYYITTPIIMNLLESRLPFEHIVVMIQKEVAQRMTSPPGTKDYGSLSIAVQYYCNAELVTMVPKTVFMPQPNVDSAVMKLTLRSQPPVHVKDTALFFDVVQAAFAQRRKTLYNNIMHRFFKKEQKAELMKMFQQCGIDPTRRGETLTMEEFALLTETIQTHLN